MPASGLRHDALFYEDDRSYVEGVLTFVREGLDLSEPVLVAVPRWNLRLLHDATTADEHRRIRFADMTVAGRNPGRIIGAVLTAFVREHCGRRVRIVGEPIWPGRTDDEYPACAEHEALINVALDGEPASILCPYDLARLSREAVHDATRTHPTLMAGGRRWASPEYIDPIAVAASFDEPLSPSPDDADVLLLNAGTGPSDARRVVHDHAVRVGLPAGRVADLREAVQELAVNTFVHSGGDGLLTVWHDDTSVVCQVQDGGHIADVLVGRRPPDPPAVGHGLFRVHQICDLVRVHRASDGLTVRVHVAAL